MGWARDYDSGTAVQAVAGLPHPESDVIPTDSRPGSTRLDSSANQDRAAWEDCLRDAFTPYMRKGIIADTASTQAGPALLLDDAAGWW